MTKFGINFQLERLKDVIEKAEFVEDMGFDAVFVNDHYMKPNGDDIPEAYLTLAAIAARTRGLRIGTAVTPIPFRHAPHLAKIVSTLDNISNGRFVFGVGAGWNQSEFEGYGIEFLSLSDRVSKTIEGLTLMKRMWTEDQVTFEGRYYWVKGGVLLPKPVQKPHPAILIGARSRRMRQIVSRLGNGWIPSYLSPVEYAKGMDAIISDAESFGRSRKELMFVYNARLVLAKSRKEGLKMLSDFVSPSGIHLLEREKELIIGSPEDCVQQLQEYVNAGVDMIVLRLHDIERFDEELRTVRDEIVGQLDA